MTRSPLGVLYAQLGALGVLGRALPVAEWVAAQNACRHLGRLLDDDPMPEATAAVISVRLAHECLDDIEAYLLGRGYLDGWRMGEEADEWQKRERIQRAYHDLDHHTRRVLRATVLPLDRAHLARCGTTRTVRRAAS